MKYTDRVLKHPLFMEVMDKIKVLETSRIYCGHQLEHGMDVARIAWIYYLEDHISIENKEDDKDLFYTCALLHDIGRVAQYETGVHHSIVGVSLAEQIMDDVQIPASWRKQILEVVSEHSQGEFSDDNKNLEYYIMKADHDCRLCFACGAKDTCKWSEDEMNHTIES